MVSLCAEFQMVKILISLCLMRPGVEHFYTAKLPQSVFFVECVEFKTVELGVCEPVACIYYIGKGVAGNGQIMPNHSLEEQNSAVRGATGSCKWVTFRAG